jgi:hypothetical protein
MRMSQHNNVLCGAADVDLHWRNNQTCTGVPWDNQGAGIDWR